MLVEAGNVASEIASKRMARRRDEACKEIVSKVTRVKE
jgi:hypothetical protein